jgi:LuxR family maltose regulon positive regulatory protein
MLMAGPAVLGRLAACDWQSALAPGELAILARAADRLAVPPLDSGAATPPPTTLLSARERDVLERIAAGDSNKLIARAFDLSPHTVKRHVANILDKLGLTSRGQAAAWYRDRH